MSICDSFGNKISGFPKKPQKTVKLVLPQTVWFLPWTFIQLMNTIIKWMTCMSMCNNVFIMVVIFCFHKSID